MEGRDHRTVFFPVIFGQLRIALHVELQGGTVQGKQQKNFSTHFKNQRGFSEGKRFRRRFFFQTIFSDDLRIHICSNDLHLGKFRINGVYMKCLFGFLFIFFQFSTNAQSYKKIHAKAILVDTKNDFLSKAVENHYAFITTPYGLNDFGKQVVKRMNEMGMMVDVSHTGEKTFWDVMATTTKPIIASHSSVYALCPVFRNLKDDQIKAIAKNRTK